MNPRTLAPTREAIEEAVQCLAAGELVAFPTETVYGLGADASNPHAVRRIFAAKGRPANHPLIVHLASAAQLSDWAIGVPAAARLLAARFWPGPLTMILARAPAVIDEVTGGQSSVGLRVPAHPVAQALLVAFGGGVAAPSANRFGRISATRAEHVIAELGAAVSLILDGGECAVGIESTIIDFTSVPGQAVLLRPGGLSIGDLAAALGYVPLPPPRAAPRASGTLASHYAPATPSVLVPAHLLEAALAQALAAGRRPGVLGVGALPEGSAVASVTHATGGAGPRDYARGLYRHLRELDAAGVDLIIIEAPPDDADWHAVNDRLRRATCREPEAGGQQ